MLTNASFLRRRWLSFAVLGLLLSGAGLCIFGHALALWLNPASPWYTWGLWGTLALSTFNAGLSFFGQAVIYRIQLLNLQNKS